MEKLEILYRNEVNWMCETFWDAGYNFWLGDESNGWLADKNFDSFADGVAWLWNEAVNRGMISR